MKAKPPVIILCFVIMYAALCYSSEGRAENITEESEWLAIESDFFTIYYLPTADLNSIYKRLNKRVFNIEGVSREDNSDSPQERVAHRMDILFKRAQDLLDIHPKNIRLKIKVFKDRETLNDEYVRVFGTRPDYKSFYIHKYTTIYTSERDISDSVIVHEMGHAVIDSYFLVTPPPKVGELLASYVDLHLED